MKRIGSLMGKNDVIDVEEALRYGHNHHYVQHMAIVLILVDQSFFCLILAKASYISNKGIGNETEGISLDVSPFTDLIDKSLSRNSFICIRKL